MKTNTIANHYVAMCIAGAKRQGYNVDALLDDAGIAHDLLDENMARVYPDHFAKLYQKVARAMNDEFLGLANSPSRLGSFNLLSELLIHCNNLEQVLLKGANFYSLFDFSLQLGLEVHEDYCELTVTELIPGQDVEHFLVEIWLTVWHRLCCWLAGRRLPILEAHFAYAKPAHVQEYNLLFYCPLHFDQDKTVLRFDNSILQLPVIKQPEDLKDMLKNAPGNFLTKPNNTASVSAQIKQLLGTEFDREFPAFEQIADTLHNTTQTLRRRLKDEGSSYQEIKDQVRRDVAIFHLSQSKLSINDIAARVGFTEPSAFHRAFKKWTGVTPGIYRQNQDEQTQG